MEQESVADESDDDLIDCDPTPPRYQRVVAKQGTADDLDLCYNGGLGPIRNRDAWAMEHGWPELCREVVMAMGEKSVD